MRVLILRQVQATDYAALHHLRDVIVLSTLGNRSMANFCSGGTIFCSSASLHVKLRNVSPGDMDGDIGTAINDPAIVGPFKPADPSYAVGSSLASSHIISLTPLEGYAYVCRYRI
jgi:hypothetical protein